MYSSVPSNIDWGAISLTLKLALISTSILLLFSIPFIWWLSRTRSKFKPALMMISTLPLVLPPTVLGFYLLIFMGPDGPLGFVTNQMGWDPLAFSFEGLVLGSVIYSLPFVGAPLYNAFSSFDAKTLNAAATLGASPMDRFFSLVVPESLHAISLAFCLGFAHTMGEFGVVLMLGGNIPGQTRVLSVAIYDHVETLEYQAAHFYSVVMILLAVFMVYLVQKLHRLPGKLV